MVFELRVEVGRRWAYVRLGRFDLFLGRLFGRRDTAEAQEAS